MGARSSTTAKEVREVENFFTPTLLKHTKVWTSLHSKIVPHPYLEWRTDCPGFSFICYHPIWMDRQASTPLAYDVPLAGPH